MAKKRNTVWKLLGGVLLVAVVLLFSIPLLLKGKIADIIKQKANQNMNATLDFEDADLSLLRSFPNANLDLKKVSLVNKPPFEGDTLFVAGDIILDMSIMQLFKGVNDPIAIKRLLLDGVKVGVKVDAEGNANYDIALPEDSANTEGAPQEPDGEPSSFMLTLQEYGITNAQITYDDYSSGMHFALEEMNQHGSGDLSLATTTIDTQTDALVSFEMDSTRYLSRNKISLDAVIAANLDENKYTFMENKALINQLPLIFDGFVKLNEDHQEVDVTFKTPSSDFKNFLAVIPEAYAASLDGVETTGNFEVQGTVKGIVDEEHIPAFKIKMNSENASFKYPNLPKGVRNVYIDTKINNDTGKTEDTYVIIDRLSFRIDEDVFNLNAKIRELLGNTKVNLHADGRMNLANLSKAYPTPEDYGLSGILAADVTTAFDMASLEKHQYEKTRTHGTASLTNFHYESEELMQPVDIEEVGLTFNPTTVSLDRFAGKMGQSDFNATGTLTNLLGYTFNGEDLEGNFKLRSDTLSMDDFMTEELEGESSDEGNQQQQPQEMAERIKIPGFLDATIDAAATTVKYDDLTLKDVAGRLRIKDETASLQNLSSSLFGGKLTLNGEVSTKQDISTFDMDLGIEEFGIAESFNQLGLFKMLAPVASSLQGKLNSTIKLSGNLKEDMTPNLATISGDLLGQLLSTKVDTQNAPALTALAGQLDFIDLNALNLDNVKAALSFEEGTVKTKPFSLNYGDIDVTMGGTHTFDGQMDYQATFDVPAKYLGSEVNGLIAKIDDGELDGLTIPVAANITGNYGNPKVSTDLTSGVSSLTNQLVEIQKQKLLNQGKSKANELIGGLLGGDKETGSDSKDAGISDALGGLLGGKNATGQQKDSTATDESSAVKKAASGILGGLFGKKKKDTVN